MGVQELADKIGVSRKTVTEWRNAKYLQAIHEFRLVQIVTALTELSKIGEDARLSDLIEINDDQLRSLEVLEYGYSNSRGRINGAPPPEAYEYVDGKKNKKGKRAAEVLYQLRKKLSSQVMKFNSKQRENTFSVRLHPFIIRCQFVQPDE
ncbi:hypothetical protein CAL7716_053220 [Calothrix sp. PCC 7716]|nr:hypothetical protein CAL7716_053220 [Calothrix sp. PCC 7716]